MIGLYVLGIVSSVAAIIVCGVLADKKGRSIGGWIVGGIFLGWIAALVLALIQDVLHIAPKLCNNRFIKLTNRHLLA